MPSDGVIHLQSMRAEDYALVAQTEVEIERLPRWRHHAISPAPDSLMQSMWQGVLNQFAVRAVDGDNFFGVVTAYEADFRNQHCKLAAYTLDPASHGRYVVRGAFLLLDYLFAQYMFRKVYAESASFNFASFASGAGTLFKEEGRLRDHYFVDGGWWDQVILSVRRDEWISRRLDSNVSGTLNEADILGGTDAKKRSDSGPGRSCELFVARLLDSIGIETAPLSEPISSTGKVAEVPGIDSLALVELECILDEMTGGQFPQQLDLTDASWADVWYYVNLGRERLAE